MRQRPSILRPKGFALPVLWPASPIKNRMDHSMPSLFKGLVQLHTQSALDYLVATLRKSW